MSKTNKFMSNLTAGNASIVGKRAGQVAKAAELEQKNLISKLEKRKNDTEMEIEELSDLSPKDTISLKPGDGFNAAQWVNRLQSLSVELALIEQELKIANKTYDEWFSVQGEKGGE